MQSARDRAVGRLGIEGTSSGRGREGDSGLPLDDAKSGPLPRKTVAVLEMEVVRDMIPDDCHLSCLSLHH